MFTQPQGTCIILIKFLPHYHIYTYFCIQSQTTSSISSSVSSAGPSMQESSSLYSDSWSFIRVKTPLQRVDGASSETQGQIVGPKTKIKTGRKVFCPIRSEYSFGRLELVRKEFVPRGSYSSFVLLLVEFFPARFDFRLRPHYLPLGLRGCRWRCFRRICAGEIIFVSKTKFSIIFTFSRVKIEHRIISSSHYF